MSKTDKLREEGSKISRWAVDRLTAMKEGKEG
jgi:hypothetical protein